MSTTEHRDRDDPSSDTVDADLLAQRYGRTGAGARRRRAVILSGVLGVVGLAWVAWAAWFQSTPEVQSNLRSFEVVDAHAVSASVTVKPRSAEVVASCLLRAFSDDHSIVGERNFKVERTFGSVNLTVPFRTERRATSVEMVGCTAGDQDRPR